MASNAVLLFTPSAENITVILHGLHSRNTVCLSRHSKKALCSPPKSKRYTLTKSNRARPSNGCVGSYICNSSEVKGNPESSESHSRLENQANDSLSEQKGIGKHYQKGDGEEQLPDTVLDNCNGNAIPPGTGSEPNERNDGDDDDNENEKSLDVSSKRDEQNSVTNVLNLRKKAINFIWNQVTLLLKYLREIFFSLFKDVPASVVATIISATATVLATKIKSAHDEHAAEATREQDRKDAKIKNDEKLRASYQELTLPLLKSCAKLADRLFQIIDGDLSLVENVPADAKTEQSQNGTPVLDSSKKKMITEPNSALYSTYLLARFFAAIEIMKNMHPLFDYGFPAADRILHNIVGRIQGVFCANDKILREMQANELFFQSPMKLDGGLLKITPREQTVLGELLCKKTWKHKYSFVMEGSSEMAPLTFLEFSQIYEKDSLMKAWTNRINRDFQKMETEANGLTREQRRNNDIGSRVFFLQSALCDLIDFFDPLPNTRAVSRLRRRRLQIDPNGSGVSQRLPTSLIMLFDEIAMLRDSRSVDGEDLLDRMKLPGKVQVEAYVTTDTVEDVQEKSIFRKMENSQRKVLKSPCALSHQVLIALTEMSIPYNTVPISPECTPRWYYFMHPDNKAPVIYHHGQVFDDLEHAIVHLNKQFPQKPKISSTGNLQIRSSTVALTKFNQSFRRWLIGDQEEKIVLESELISLNQMISKVQSINDGKPFFGGNKFSYEDILLTPFLHHVDIVGGRIKEWEIPKECVALKKYLSMARERSSFIKTVPSDEALVQLYDRMISKGSLSSDRLADLLE